VNTTSFEKELILTQCSNAFRISEMKYVGGGHAFFMLSLLLNCKILSDESYIGPFKPIMNALRIVNLLTCRPD
jgi:hypothetical protein